MATREGIKVILAGAIDLDAGAYTLTVQGIDPSDGKTLWTDTARARSKQEVLGTLAQLAADARKQLGDTAPKSTRLAAAETFTAGALSEVIRSRKRRGRDLHTKCCAAAVTGCVIRVRP